MAEITEEKRKLAWNKATIATGDNDGGKEWRKDGAGAWININQHGMETEFGWEVDHAFPKSKGGTEDIYNLRAMHWKNNRTKADDFPSYKTATTSEGTKNINKELSWEFTAEFITKLKLLYPTNPELKTLKTA